MLAIEMPSLKPGQHTTIPDLSSNAETDAHPDIPIGDQSTELRVGAPRDEFDIVGHLIEHVEQSEEKKRRGEDFLGMWSARKNSVRDDCRVQGGSDVD